MCGEENKQGPLGSQSIAMGHRCLSRREKGTLTFRPFVWAAENFGGCALVRLAFRKENDAAIWGGREQEKKKKKQGYPIFDLDVSVWYC
mmetsp:Transcript_17839/g.36253  ORF Transcript_17839/g.36253 Transcript_17839/m.36253 type:complete len:89 (+) Transcript_17839:324-590(+)